MIKSKITRLFIAGTAGLLISCNATNNSGLEKTVYELQENQKNIQEQIVQIKALQSSNQQDIQEQIVQIKALQSSNQQDILKKIQSMEKSIVNFTLANKSRPAKTQQPKVDPNKVYSVKIGNSFVKGNKNAKVTIIEWADYFWPHCRIAVSLMDEIMKKYPNDVKYVLKNGPRGNLNESNTKYAAALYAVAAGQQGKYFEMSHKMFDKSNNTRLKKDPGYAVEIAKELGLDLEQFKQDYKSAKVKALVVEEKQEFANLGKQGMARLGVPKFLINGKEPKGRRSVESWSAIIEAELK